MCLLHLNHQACSAVLVSQDACGEQQKCNIVCLAASTLKLYISCAADAESVMHASQTWIRQDPDQ